MRFREHRQPTCLLRTRCTPNQCKLAMSWSILRQRRWKPHQLGESLRVLSCQAQQVRAIFEPLTRHLSADVLLGDHWDRVHVDGHGSSEGTGTLARAPSRHGSENARSGVRAEVKPNNACDDQLTTKNNCDNIIVCSALDDMMWYRMR